MNKLAIPVALLVALAGCAQSPGKSTHSQAAAQLTRDQVIDARRHFRIEVLSFDASKPYGSGFPYSDYVRLRITNHSNVTLPYITPLTRRYSGGRTIGWSRAPVIDVQDLGPKTTKMIDYYPHGHLSVVPVDKLTVEIESTVDDDDLRLFKELLP